MVVIVVLTQVQAGKSEHVRTELESLDDIEWAHVVTGPYDVIAYGELEMKKDFRGFVDKVHEIEGVIRTETCMGL